MASAAFKCANNIRRAVSSCFAFFLPVAMLTIVQEVIICKLIKRKWRLNGQVEISYSLEFTDFLSISYRELFPVEYFINCIFLRLFWPKQLRPFLGIIYTELHGKSCSWLRLH